MPTQWLLIISSLLFFFVYITTGYTNLPTYTNPGSFLGCETGYEGSGTYKLYVALWDGTTGQNYTTWIGTNITFHTFVPNVYESVIVLTYSAWGVNNHTLLSLLKYQPKTAPHVAGPSCALPVSASNANAFMMNNVIYAIVGNVLYRIDHPSQAESDCQLNKVADLPVSFSAGYGSLSIVPNHVSFVSGLSLVEMTFTSDGNVTVTSQTMPGYLGGTWEYIQEDPSTGDYYYTSSSINNRGNITFWKGSRGPSSSTTVGSPITWTFMQFWRGITPGTFNIDARKEDIYKGPLFCSSDSVSMTACWTWQSELAWKGPRLQSAFNGDSGSMAWPVYDPNCN